MFGPRVCAGIKFSQVEYAAVVFELVRCGIRVGVRGNGAEGEGEEREKLKTGMRDMVFNIGTRIRREGDVGVRFYRD